MNINQLRVAETVPCARVNPPWSPPKVVSPKEEKAGHVCFFFLFFLRKFWLETNNMCKVVVLFLEKTDWFW